MLPTFRRWQEKSKKKWEKKLAVTICRFLNVLILKTRKKNCRYHIAKWRWIEFCFLNAIESYFKNKTNSTSFKRITLYVYRHFNWNLNVFSSILWVYAVLWAFVVVVVLVAPVFFIGIFFGLANLKANWSQTKTKNSN